MRKQESRKLMLATVCLAIVLLVLFVYTNKLDEYIKARIHKVYLMYLIGGLPIIGKFISQLDYTTNKKIGYVGVFIFGFFSWFGYFSLPKDFELGLGFLLILSGILVGGLIKGKSNFSKPRMAKRKYYYNMPVKGGYIPLDHKKLTLVFGGMGAQKSRLVLANSIKETIKSGRSIIMNDFAWPDLSKYVLVYKYKFHSPIEIINLDPVRVELSEQYNFLKLLDTQTKRQAFANVFMMSLQKGRIGNDPFWVKSSIGSLYMGLEILFSLSQIYNPRFFSFPHLMMLFNKFQFKELVQIGQYLIDEEKEVQLTGAISQMRSVLFSKKDKETLVNIEISMKADFAKFNIPEIYWIFKETEDNPIEVNPKKKQQAIIFSGDVNLASVLGSSTAGAISTILGHINTLEDNGLEVSIISDESHLLYMDDLDTNVAVARKNGINFIMATQIVEQYSDLIGDKKTEKIVSLAGNVIVGQVSGKTQQIIIDRFGKQDKEEISETKGRSNSKNYSIKEKDLVKKQDIEDLQSGDFFIATKSSMHILGKEKLFKDSYKYKGSIRGDKSIEETLKKVTFPKKRKFKDKSKELKENMLSVMEDINKVYENMLYILKKD